jgi:ferredoxin
MVVAEIKPFEEIKEMLKNYKNILVLGCGTCVAVCLTGGKKQVELLASALRMANKIDGNDVTVGERTLGRQCEPKFVDQLTDDVQKYDVVLSMGCGAGVQELAQKLKKIPVLPAMNTRFIGSADEEGNFTEMCAACGDCILSFTGGICPVANCPKGLLNGPCGGTKDGKCEVSNDIPCAWVMIYERLKDLGKLDDIKKIMSPKKWSRNQRPGKFKVKEKIKSEEKTEKTVSK